MVEQATYCLADNGVLLIEDYRSALYVVPLMVLPLFSGIGCSINGGYDHDERIASAYRKCNRQIGYDHCQQ